VLISGDTSALNDGARVRIAGEDDGSEFAVKAAAGGPHGAH